MSDYSELNLFVSGIVVQCIIPDPGSTVTQFFLIYNFWPIFLSYVMFGLTLVRCDYPFLLLTMTNFIDNGINYGLRKSFGESSNYQPDTCPLLDDQMPAMGAQRISVLYTVVWFLATFIYPTSMSKSNILFVNFSSVMALYSRLYLGFSTPKEMIVGSVFGVVEGICLSTLFYYMKVREFDSMIATYMTLLHDYLGGADFISHRHHD